MLQRMAPLETDLPSDRASQLVAALPFEGGGAHSHLSSPSLDDWKLAHNRGNMTMHHGDFDKPFDKTVQILAFRRRRAAIRGARSATKPQTCWEVLPAHNLLSHPRHIGRGRCAIRSATWKEAARRCLRMPWCSGITRDSGLRCDETKQQLRYELRLGVVESRTQSHVERFMRSVPFHVRMIDLTTTTSWLLRSSSCELNREALVNGHRSAPPHDDERLVDVSGRWDRAMSADQSRKAYFQSHWHPGMEEGDSCLRMRRLGNHGDGGKMVCFDVTLTPHGAGMRRLVSVGIGNDFSFEEAMLQREPQCTIDVFDGTNFGRGKPPTVPAGLHFHWENFNRTSFHRFRSLEVDIIKMDCEGCEYSGVLTLLAPLEDCTGGLKVAKACPISPPVSPCAVRARLWPPNGSLPGLYPDCFGLRTALLPFVRNLCPAQVLFELHIRPLIQMHSLMLALNRSYIVYYREPNIEFSDGQPGIRKSTNALHRKSQVEV